MLRACTPGSARRGEKRWDAPEKTWSDGDQGREGRNKVGIRAGISWETGNRTDIRGDTRCRRPFRWLQGPAMYRGQTPRPRSNSCPDAGSRAFQDPGIAPARVL